MPNIIRRIIFVLTLILSASLQTKAQYDFIRPVKDAIPGGYNFWVYTPTEYYYTLNETPVIIFLHGQSLCGRDLNRVRRYGPLDAIVKGRQVDALVVVPQNPGGAWNPKKINDVLEWTKQNYACDSTRVYVIGMSLGGYGTLDFACTYPDKVAAALAMCGGCSKKDRTPLGKLPLWIIHGTADRAVSISQSKSVVNDLEKSGNDSRLRYTWLQGANHGAPARFFYMRKTYDWLFSHSLLDPDRPVNKEITLDMSDLPKAYRDMDFGKADPETVYETTIK
ncbi:MAG: alpha/beta hydrolase-fold protein [Prevotella pectinovora]|uniref:carboxylesterase family protein n=1 Tax=Prevotella pectinovora TaxID=1602169 RepID=UPI002E778FAB|nr:alpha/beta hydrolase-fold protein [Prevotella pectinovora]MEE1547528.1 alpha/beta hydrolase-fold protein [Prevotella pectinovora]